MKTKRRIIRWLALMGLATFSVQLTTAQAQGTAFTYQGRLVSGTGPANGSYDLTFAIFNVSSNGTPVAGPLTNSATGVTNGLFTVSLDFGPGIFTGPNYWLELGVRTNGNGNFATLAPRQPTLPVPYAIMANSASNLLGNLSTAQISGIVPLDQLPAAVVTNNESSVTFNNLSLDGNLNLPATTASAGIIYSSGSPLIHAFGISNFFAGMGAGNFTMTGTGNVGIGQDALQFDTTGSYNTAVGQYSLSSNTTGRLNTGIGESALLANTTGIANSAMGQNALRDNTTGSYNTGSGENALMANTTGSLNTANGQSALHYNTTGSYNTANGCDALYSNIDGGYNTANGEDALFYNTSGSYNEANGYQALLYNTTGHDNMANGYKALLDNLTGAYNTANGNDALYLNTSGSFNVADGDTALAENRTGNNNIALGYLAGNAIVTSDYNIDIGNQGVAGDSGIIRIGDTNYQTATYLAGDVYASGSVTANSVYVTSDRNAKENFTPVDAQALLAKVAALPLTEWNYKADPAAQKHIGPMAQDFQAAFGLNGPDDKHISVVDEGGVALAAIQGLNEVVKEKDAKIDELEKRLADLDQAVQALSARK